jgi:aerobic-type carbon monoxide dehydrogenase small subunit (CoxS/CutS family)
MAAWMEVANWRFSMADPKQTHFSRRGFLKGAGLTAAGTLLEQAQTLTAEVKSAVHEPASLGPDAVAVRLHVNGQVHATAVEPRDTLATTLRDKLGLTGTKVVCDRGSCSACTVWVDDKPQLACMTLTLDVGGKKVTTIEGLSEGEKLHPVQAAFVKHDAMQCGFCTPGMVMACASLLKHNAHPSRPEVAHAISGNLCRCGTYPRIFDAMEDLSKQGSTATASAGLVMPRTLQEV